MIDQDERDEDIMPVAIVAAQIRATRSCAHALRPAGACSLCIRPNVARTTGYVFRLGADARALSSFRTLRGAPDEDGDE